MASSRSKNKPSNDELQDFDREELRLLYAEVLADIRFWKNQQWLTTTYVIGIYIAFVSICDKLIDVLHCLEYKNIFDLTIFIVCVLLFILTIVVMIVGCCIIDNYSKDITTSNGIKGRIISRYQNDFKEILYGNSHDTEHKSSYVQCVLKAVTICGGIFVLGYCLVDIFLTIY